MMASDRGEYSAGSGWLARLAARPVLAALALVLLSLAVDLPGVIRLPAVDRTEVVFAESTRAMVERGDWRDPRYGGVVHQFRPVGTYWLQGASASIAEAEHARDIWVYRLPSMFAVALAVGALYWLAAPLVGARPAFIAAALFAVAPLTVLIGHLAIADGIALLPATVAMLALLRMYAATDEAQSKLLALLLWIAIGFGMLINALQTPILVGVTLTALAFMDRDFSWLKRTRALIGLPIALLIASPWIFVRVHQDGVPFAGMNWGDFLEALGGSQDMKLRAFPGTFLLALALGFLPGTALLPAASRQIWHDRANKLPRFLLAWVIGYLIYLEALSSKPGTYAVQVMFPALALAVAMLIARQPEAASPPAWHTIPPAIIAGFFAILLFGFVYAFTRQVPTHFALTLIAAVIALFAWSAHEGRSGRLAKWWMTSVAAFGLFAVALIAVILPSIEGLWPARQIERALRSCQPTGPIGLLGLREPTAFFLLNADKSLQSPDAIAARRPGLDVIEGRWIGRYHDALAARGSIAGPEIGCVEAYNVMRGCRLTFSIFANNLSGSCTIGAPVACQAEIPRETSKSCD